MGDNSTTAASAVRGGGGKGPSWPERITPPEARLSNKEPVTIKIVDTIEDLMKVFAVRSAVYLSEQSCPYGEEFDGNDFSGTHLLGLVGGEPAASMRVRYFAGFAKLERFAVRQGFRRSGIARKMARAAIELCRIKGYTTIYGHAQDPLLAFWARFGGKPVEPRRPIEFSDYRYTEVVIQTKPHPEALSLTTDPYVLIRPEGRWDRPGVLEQPHPEEPKREPVRRPRRPLDRRPARARPRHAAVGSSTAL